MSIFELDSGNTLSTAFRPGEDLRFANTSSDSIFTFGDYRIERGNESDLIINTENNLFFSPFSTLENMGIDDFNQRINTSIQNNELRPINSDPFSYTYFGSFYTEIARSINNIIDTFPYAALAFDDFNGVTIYDYNETYNNTTGQKTSNFKIPANVIINEGYILFNSGSSIGNKISLMTQTNLFEIQLSGSTTAQTESFSINTYSYSPGVSAYLEFEINGHLSNGAVIPITGNTSVLPVYIRPSRKRFTEYKMKQSRLERQLLGDGVFDIPDVDDEKNNFTYRIKWPRTRDGFNPDISGDSFEEYKSNMLLLAENTDMDKTDIMIKTMIPENFIQFDTKTQIYQKLINSYAKQFDEIKQFIDNIAYAHSINYNNEESVPEKFLIKLSNLLGWKLSSSFSEIDLFEYLADEENSEKKSFAYYNVEMWKRILININWLYKKKGTRDALQFIFKLMGAPECLLVFNEFVYDIEQTFINENDIDTTAFPAQINKSNSKGFINYEASEFIFQEGGLGRGNGQKYINQWAPQFNPTKRINNIKVQVGDENFFGSENIINTKEVYATLSPSNAIECDVFGWYKLSGTCWVWGSESPYFSSNTVPYEYTIDNCEFVSPENISEMNLNDYIQFIYTSNIEPRNRKTNSQVHTTFGYPELKKIYMNYYLMSYPQSNKLTIKKLEAFLNLIESNFQDYLLQLIPATTILESQGTTYKNTVFQRQRFIYKEGINDGSEFQNKLPPDLRPSVKTIQLEPKINNFYNAAINSVIINSDVSQGITNRISPVKIEAYINQNNIITNVEGFGIYAEIQEGISSPPTGP